MSKGAVASVRHVTPILPSTAAPNYGSQASPWQGRVAEIYRQVKADLGIVGPAITMFSPAPELLAATWSLLRESLLVGGPEERRAKEVVATAVSVKNSCRFCVEAHSMMLHALGEHETAEALQEGRTPSEYADVAAWAVRPSRDGPFEAEAAPRFIGTMLAFEVITRLVKALVTDGSPHSAVTTRLGRAVASRQFRSIVEADLEPGTSLPLLDDRPRWLEEEWPELDLSVPDWAGESPVGIAFAHLRAVASCGGGLLHEDAAEAVRRTVARSVDWRGTDLVTGTPELEGIEQLPERAAIGARLAAAAALDPGSITDADVAAWRSGSLSDHCTVFVHAFAVVHAADRIQANLTVIDPAEKGAVDA